MEYFTINEVAKMQNVKKQSVYIRIASKKLKATKNNGKWFIEKNDLQEYEKNKWTREDLTKNNEKVFDIKKNRVSIRYLCQMLNIDPQRVYYLIRKGIIPHERSDSSYVFDLSKINVIKDNIKFRIRKEKMHKIQKSA